MKNSIFTKLLGYTFFIVTAFAVFFDPTEMALGSKLIQLTPFWLDTAEVFGNVIWILGVLYCFIILGSTLLLFNSGVYKESLEKTKQNPKELSMIKRHWFDVPLFLISFTVAVIALGSGFWFTGSTWILALVLSRAVKIRIGRDTAINLETE